MNNEVGEYIFAHNLSMLPIVCSPDWECNIYITVVYISRVRKPINEVQVSEITRCPEFPPITHATVSMHGELTKI